MYLTLEKANGEINASPSKSHLLRLLFLSYMANENSFIRLSDNELCDDVKDGISCAGIFGKECKTEPNGIEIRASSYKDSCHIEGSAASLRFLLACGSIKGRKFSVSTGKNLFSRPHDELIDVLNSNGAKIAVTDNGFTVDGKTKPGIFNITAEKSSQYISSLLLSLPFVNGDSIIAANGEITSKPYIRLTLSVLKDAGIDIKTENNLFFVKGNTILDGINSVCEGDWSSAAVFLCMGAVSGRVKVNGVSRSSVQGDKAICDILNSSGAVVSSDENSVTVEKSKNSPFVADITDIPDLAPVLASYAVFCDGTSVLNNVKRLKYKESDRESFIKTVISSSESRVFEKNGNIYIEKGEFKERVFDSLGDHRNVFLASILSAKGKIGIIGEECVKKSCPLFFEKFVKIGGKIL